MVGIIIFFAGFLQAIFGLMGRMPYMLYFGLVLMLGSFFCFGDSRKIYRWIVAALCGIYTGFCIYSTCLYGIDYHYYTLNAVFGGLLSAFILVSLLPEKEEENEEDQEQ